MRDDEDTRDLAPETPKPPPKPTNGPEDGPQKPPAATSRPPWIPNAPPVDDIGQLAGDVEVILIPADRYHMILSTLRIAYRCRKARAMHVLMLNVADLLNISQAALEAPLLAKFKGAY